MLAQTAQVSRSAKRRRHSTNPLWLCYLLIILGSLTAAVSFNLLLRPFSVSAGGVVGASIVAQKLFSWEPALFQWTLNLGILFACWKPLGRKIVINSLTALLLIPAFVYITRHLPCPTTNLFLAATVGASGIGAGLGLVFRAGASVGGFSAVALAMHKQFGWSVARGLLTLDAIVLTIGVAVLDGEQWLASLVAVYIMGKTARAVMTGLNRSVVATIISRHTSEIRVAILNQLALGLTVLNGRGGYRNEDCEVLMVVIAPGELVGLKHTIRGVDPQAFVVVSEASEVLGHGFTPHT